MGRKISWITWLVLALFLLPGSAIHAAWGPAAYQDPQVSPSRLIAVRFEGVISEIHSNAETGDETWIVADVEVIVAEETVITPAGYEAAVGDWARVTAVYLTEDMLLARHVHIRIGAIQAAPYEFRGPIEAVEGSGEEREIVVAGLRVAINAETEVSGELRVGYVATVAGERLPSGIIRALQVATLSPQEAATLVEVKGWIKELHEEWWLLSLDEDIGNDSETDLKVWIADAEIPRQGHIGLGADVKGYRRPDGSLAATYILVEEVTPAEEMRLTGIVESISEEVWVIETAGGRRTIYLDAHTFVDESRAPATTGNRARVFAVQRLDGSLLAFRIRLERPD